MAVFETIARVGEIPEGEGRSFVASGRVIGLFLIDGEYHAINDLCPHMGASLSAGYLEGDAVYCPWHAWRFCVRDGTWLDNPKVRTDCYPVRIEGDQIQVELPDESADDPPGSADTGNGSTDTPE